MADASGPSGGGYDYVQDSTNIPTNPELGQEWYQPDTNDVKTYDGGTWVDVKISDHAQLSGVNPGSHHNPATVSDPLTNNGGQELGLALGSGLDIDNSGQVFRSGGSDLKWQEVENSPLVIDRVDSGTIQLNNVWASVKLVIVDSDNPANVELTVNGDSGSNYDYRTSGGSFVSDSASVAVTRNADDAIGAEVHINGIWNNECIIDLRNNGVLSNTTIAARNRNVTSPLDSITVQSVANFDNFRVKVYGFPQ